MKNLLYFESFKVKNITIKDIVECIENGGVIYASIVYNFPDNDPEIPMTPLSIDESGTVTVDIDGRNFEVELKNIEKIEWM
jgi:hypothetical protein